VARQRQQYTQTYKLEALRRMDAAPDDPALARELGIRRELLYRWHHIYKACGETGPRRSGRPRQNLLPLSLEVEPVETPKPGAGEPGDDLVRAQARIAELERKIGRQQLDLDFFRAALRHVRDKQPMSGVPGATASTR